ncbi:MAG: PD-(D/E)XK motif protein [Hyphomonas sp.]
MTVIYWGVLREHDRSGPEHIDGLPSEPVGAGTAQGRLRIALSFEGHARFLVPVDMRTRQISVEEGTLLTVALSTLHIGGAQCRFIDIVCRERYLEPIFSDFCEEICRKIEKGEAGARAVEGTFREYRSLFAVARSREISLEKITGLLGELEVLKWLLEYNSEAVRNWLGPTGNRHDFSASGVSAEVKTTLSSGSDIITISSLEQLSPSKDRALHLLFLRFEEVGGQGLRISRQIAHMRERCADQSLLDERLKMLDYYDEDADKWDERAFAFVSRRFFRVEDDFPRLGPDLLSEGELRQGIGKVSYQLDLRSASRFALEQGEEVELLEKLGRAGV